jgi:hypothetical protein
MMTRLVSAAALLIVNTAFADMQVMDNQSLSAITAQDGVGLSLEMRLNANADGSTKCGVSIPLMECRIAIGFNNRGTANVDQEWLVLKGISGLIKIPYLALDASTVTYGSNADGTGTQTTNASAAKFSADPNNPIRITNLVINNISVEMDTASVRGFMAPLVSGADTGFMGLKIDDSNSISTTTTPFIGIQLSGSVKMFPCSGGSRC